MTGPLQHHFPNIETCCHGPRVWVEPRSPRPQLRHVTAGAAPRRAAA
eukprot:CAMPEP_0174861808 /NCGR_PEP_ID=MMETSP1114-20130205/52482_1 /TAXON_ID=312471 /ORGANISM="Neobodo designis, Strain CCAP 1951/1" /LENGTH=46 /DNA_ID= /DNA_START= /DNA_END= /DNA_ORIENTATION=